MKQFLLNVVLLAMVGLFLTADIEAAENSLTSTCEVTSSDNSGPGTLRDCLIGAQQGDVITFDTAVFPYGSPTTISLTTDLPALVSGNVTINACNAGVILDGDNAVDNGLTIQSDDNRIFGLEITRFSTYGIYIDGSVNQIGGGDICRGINHWNVVTDCDTGIAIAGSGSAHNAILANLIGGCRIGIQLAPLGAYIESHMVRGNGIGRFPISVEYGNEIGILLASGQNHVVNHNFIAHNTTGIRVEADATTHPVDPATRNCFESNTIGVSHAGTAEVRIEGSWWGAANGPSGVGPGDGDIIEEVGTGTVDYEPWIASPGVTCGYVIFFGDFDQIGATNTCRWSAEEPETGPPCADSVYSVLGLTVSFLNKSRGALPLSFAWDFGDGSPISSAENPQHTYSSPSTYSVMLTVTNSLGTHSISQAVTVQN